MLQLIRPRAVIFDMDGLLLDSELVALAFFEQAAPRSYDVARFYGDPARARAFLGWEPDISLEAGLMRLIEDFRQELALRSVTEASA
jgi:beta-phosphoglucomutase-like phosphatase (HAD superfamily)